nr:unnamed protein product [Haemonchus contortus]
MDISQFYDDEPYKANALTLHLSQMERREPGMMMAQSQRSSGGVPFGNATGLHSINAPPTSAANNASSSRKMQHPFQGRFFRGNDWNGSLYAGHLCEARSSIPIIVGTLAF